MCTSWDVDASGPCQSKVTVGMTSVARIARLQDYDTCACTDTSKRRLAPRSSRPSRNALPFYLRNLVSELKLR